MELSGFVCVVCLSSAQQFEMSEMEHCCLISKQSHSTATCQRCNPRLQMQTNATNLEPLRMVASPCMGAVERVLVASWIGHPLWANLRSQIERHVIKQG